jgi:glutamate/tyrosine decarboxylase-like PLP-dependent enzyme
MSRDPATSRFSWHPEPELIGFQDEAVSRPAMERLGAAAWAVCLDYLYRESLRRPMGPDTYPEMRRRLFATGAPAPAPVRPLPSAEVLDELRRIAPLQYNAHHTRSFSYFTPPPLLLSIVGELFCQWANQGVDIWHASPSAALVEEEVVRWLADLVGYGSGGFGVLTSGGVMANVMALTLARDLHLRTLLRTGAGSGPVPGPAPVTGSASELPPAPVPRGRALDGVRVYASDQAHFSIARALDFLGFPEDTLRIVPSDERFRLQAGPVEEAIRADRAAGLVPLAIAAVAGSTNTGSIDRLDALADVAEREGLWFHVDAAFGGAVRLSPRLAGRVPEYYRTSRPEEAPLNWYQYSFEGTRRFRGLKLWLSWKHLGSEGLARLVEMNCDLAAHLAGQIAKSDDFEAAPAEPELSVVCFRHLPGGRAAAARLAPEALDRHQDRLQRALEVSGDGWVSTTKLRGRTFLRAGILNYLSTDADADRLLLTLRRLAEEKPAGSPWPESEGAS